MICQPCRVAGAIAFRTPSDMHPAPKAEAEELHKQCESPLTCPCHHRVKVSVLANKK